MKLGPRSVRAAGIEIATMKSGFGKFGMSGIVPSQNPVFGNYDAKFGARVGRIVSELRMGPVAHP